ncbi:hypothetical protein M885DRAFT_622492 [Pelagophyceae sp. CCMP2097]|nr:hypothetical protein M885DRAFT_622492 [Pelagophyceae sp. CCMP2097]
MAAKGEGKAADAVDCKAKKPRAESKSGDGDDDGPPFIDVLAKCARRLAGAGGARALEAFKRKHATAFPATRSNSGAVEHALAHTQLHADYLALWEAEVDAVLRAEGVSLGDFVAQARSALQGDFTALFEEHEHAEFVDALLAALTFEHFFEVMAGAARNDHGDDCDDDRRAHK